MDDDLGRVRAGLKLAILAMSVLLLSLTPYHRVFTETMRQGETHRAAGKYSAALEAYQQAAGRASESPLPWLRMGEILRSQHRFQAAATAYGEAERVGAGVDGLLGKGESHAASGDWAAAMRTWLRAQRIAPADPRVPIALARGGMAQGRFEQATGLLTLALELEPSTSEAAKAHSLLGQILVGEDPDQAADHFRQAGDEEMLAVLAAAEAEPDRVRQALLLGIAFLQRDDLALARRELERAVALDPTHAEAHAYLAHILDRQGETLAAGRLLGRALELDPDSTLAYYFSGVHQRQVGNLELAQDALWEALLRDPDNAALRVQMAEAFLDKHEYENAEEWYRTAVEVAPEEIEFHLLLVNFYLNVSSLAQGKGLPATEVAVKLAPEDARAQDLLGWAYHLSGRHAEAEQTLLTALSLDAELVSALYHLGTLYANTGRQDLARQFLMRVVDLDTGGYLRSRAQQQLQRLR